MLVRPTTDVLVTQDVLPGTAWRLEDLGGAGVLDKVEATLEFTEGGKIARPGSCNSFSVQLKSRERRSRLDRWRRL